MFSHGSMAHCIPELVFIYWMARDVKTFISARQTTTLTNILRLVNAVEKVMKFDKRFELVLGVCVHETLRRVTLSAKAFRRICNDDENIIAAAVTAVSGIMKVVVSKFTSDLKRMPSYKRDILLKGAWKEPSVADWLNTLWQSGPYCVATDSRPPAEMQVHYTQATAMIQKLAGFLARKGCEVVSELPRTDVRTVGKDIFKMFGNVFNSKCYWLAGDLALTLNGIIKNVIEEVTGDPAPEGALLEALRGL